MDRNCLCHAQKKNTRRGLYRIISAAITNCFCSVPLIRYKTMCCPVYVYFFSEFYLDEKL